MQRYVVHVYSGYEKRVKESLVERIKEDKLTEFFGEILIPTEKVVEMKAGKKRESERKFYPGYVVVQMEMNNTTRKLVSDTPKVLGFLGGGTADKPPMPISEKEADIILQKVQDSVGKPKPKVLFTPGEVIRVNDGPFSDFNGVVEEVNYDKNRLRVAVLIFGRSTPVDLDFSQVEKA
jgi:transcriptional antiterminator NusG